MLTRLILLTVIWLTACTPSSSQIPDSQFTKTEKPDTTPPPASTALDPQPTSVESANPASRAIVERVKADLAERLSLHTDQIQVMETRAINWSDTSLGCPQPNLEYAQILTPGYWVLLEAEGKQYAYHTDRTGQFILCLEENPDIQGLPSIPVTPGEIDDGEPWMPVD